MRIYSFLFFCSTTLLTASEQLTIVPTQTSTPTATPESTPTTPTAPASQTPEALALAALKPLVIEQKSDFQELDTTDPEAEPILHTATATADNAKAFEPINIEESVTPVESIDTLLAGDDDDNETTDEEASPTAHSQEAEQTTAQDAPPAETDVAVLTQEESNKRMEALKEGKAEALKKEEEKEIEKSAAAKKNEDLFAYNLTGLKEAGVDISKNGFGLTGKFCFFGDQYIRATLAINTDGFFGQGYINKLNIGDLIVLTGKGPDGVYGTADDGVTLEIKMNKKVQRISFSGLYTFFRTAAQTEVIISPDYISLMARMKLLNNLDTVFLAEFKPTDLDFLIAAAIEMTFLQQLEKIVCAALDKVGEGISYVGDKGQEAVAKAQRDVEKYKDEIASLQKKLDAAQKDYFDKMNGAQKRVDDAVKKVEEATANLAGELSKILDARQKMLNGRKKIAAAAQKVNSLLSEMNDGKRKLKKIAKGMKWYEFWKVGELAYWSAKVAALGVAFGVARGTLETVKGLVAPLAELLTITYGLSYAAGEVALKTSYGVLEAALVAANPLTMDDFGEILGFSIALNSAKIAYYTAQGALYTAQGASMGIEQTGKGFSIATKGIVKGLLGAFRIDGGGFKCLFSDLKKGKIDLYLIAVVLTQKKNLKLTLDLDNPDKTLASLGSMIVDLLNPTSNGNINQSVFAEIEEARKKFAPEFEELEKKKQELMVEKDELTKKKEERAAALASLKMAQDERLAQMRKQFPFTAEDIKAMGSINFMDKEQTVSIVDENNPVSYTVNNMKNTFRWLEKWKLPETNKGSVLFDVAGDSDVQIGFHTTAKSADQKSNKEYEVIIGAEGNTKTLLRTSEGVILFESSDTDSQLKKIKPGTYQSFWISFDTGYIAIGRGTVPGKELLYDWYIKTLTNPIEYFSFSSAANQLSFVNIATASVFSKPFGSQYSTQDGYNQCSWFEQLTLPELNKGTLTFDAKASSHIMVGFTDNAQAASPRYAIMIGTEDNKKSTMATTSSDGKTYTYHTVTEDKLALIPAEKIPTYHPYWVTFNEGAVTVGTGNDPTKNICMEMYSDPKQLAPTIIPAAPNAPPAAPPAAPTDSSAPQPGAPATTEGFAIRYFSFSSWDDPVEIRNIRMQPAVPVKTGTRYSAVNRKYACGWKEAWKLPAPGKGIITWEGKGLSDMGLALHTNGSAKPDEYTIRCLIGTEKNSKTILQGPNGTLITETTDPASMIQDKDTYGAYWFSYDEGYCMLGTGRKPGENSVLEYATKGEPITHFAFTNNDNYIEFKSIEIIPLPAETLPRGSQYTAPASSALFHNSAWTCPQKPDILILCAAKTTTGFSLGLHDSLTDTSKIAATLTLGHPTAMKTSVTQPDEAQPLSVELKNRFINDSYNFYPYWVHYTQATGALSYGYGIQPHTNIIGSTTLTQKPTIAGFSIGNPTSAPAYFKKIGCFAVDDPTIATLYADIAACDTFKIGDAPQKDITYTWNDSWKCTTPNTALLTFAAKAPHSIAVALGNKEDGALYEIMYGDQNNQETVILKNKTIVARSRDSDAIIPSPDNNYTYWINYYKGHITVGIGAEATQNQFLEWFDTETPKTVSHFSVSSRAEGVIFNDITYKPGIKLPLNQTYSACSERGAFTWPSYWTLAKPEKGCITFEVKTNDTAFIGLGKPGKAIYSVSLGATCALLKENQVLISSQKKYLQDGMYTPFWIIFDKGYLACGSGNTPSAESVILESQNFATVDIIQNFSLSSSNGQATYRNIQSIPSDTKKYSRNVSWFANAQRKSYAFSDKWKLPAADQGTILCDIKGDGPYYIGLEGTLIRGVDPSLEVVIGAADNTCTQIRKKGKVVAQTQDPRGIINSSDFASHYWISYNKGTIMVGVDTKPGENTILSWTDFNPESILYTDLSSDQTAVTYSHIRLTEPAIQQSSSDYIIAAETSTYMYNPTWKLAKTNFGSFTWKAKAKNDICIGLSAGINNTPRYEIVIGAENNSCTQIRCNKEVVASINNADAKIKSGFIPEEYWLSYDNGSIALGKGNEPGKKLLLFWYDPAASSQTGSISHIGFASGSEMVTLQNIIPKSGIPLLEHKYHTSSNKKGVFTWNPKCRIKPNQTITLDALTPSGGVYIGLNPLSVGVARYSLLLGGWQNTKSALFKDGKLVEQFDLTLKTIGSQQLWITYRPESITIGSGEPHTKELYTWKNPTPDTDIQFFSVTSDYATIVCQNISVIPAQSIVKPKAVATTPAIQISPAPSAVPVKAEPSALPAPASTPVAAAAA